MKASIWIMGSLFLVACDGYAPKSAAIKNTKISSGVLWGDDNRVAVKANESDPLLRAQIQATVAIIPNENIKNKTKETYTFKKQLLHQFQNFCPEVQFQQDEVLSRCSGILIGEDRILTAGHCVKDLKDCQAQIYAFGYYENQQTNFPAKDIYRCKKVILNSQSAEMKDPNSLQSVGFDLAVVQLDRPVQDRIPYELSSTPFDYVEPIRIIGTSQGLSLRVRDANIYYIPSEQDYLVYADSDTFSGDSGAPVFSSTGDLKGIVTAGSEDFELDTNRQCLKPVLCTEETCQGEAIFHPQELAKFLGKSDLFKH